ncbi:MFS transporter [Ktedonosporobacter rubrisoli]|uniref:MFS transporter n=1 Tax=Ktedonosporobacter rubrisoli TaxID=2509675 RepID=A0A4V0YYU8_KTERU|nr:MFS transporter [Ktedonosporobacter rubrisoli]QBD77471.1 MFS transporter [Ktedonosporobacter rubrisoli]
MPVISNSDSISISGSSRLKTLFINRKFALLFFGQAISLLGDQIFVMILIVWIAAQIATNQPWAPLATSGLLIASTIPSLLIAPLAGVFIDRWDRRKTMLWMDFMRGVLLIVLFLLPFFQKYIHPFFLLILIYIAIFCENVCSEFFGPARFALIGDIVPEEKRPQAISMEQISQALSVILGPPIAAPLLFGVGAQWAFLFDALTFVLSFCAICAVRLPASLQQNVDEVGRGSDKGTSGAGIRAEFREGLHFVFGNKAIRVLVISVFLLTLSLGSFTPLSVFFIQQNLHVSVSDTGILLAFFGVGAIVGAALSGAFAQRIGIKRLFVCAIILAGILFILFSRLNSFLLACIVILAIGAMQAATNVASAPILLKETPRSFIGRVSSIMNPLATIGTLISVSGAGYVSGILLEHFHLEVFGFTFGPVDTIYTISGIIIALTGIFAAFSLTDARKYGQATRQA